MSQNIVSDSTAQHDAFNHISVKRNRPWKGEEEVRIAWVTALEAALGLHFDAERAKKDCSYNNVIIEFKAPGYFKSSKSSAKFKEATDDRLLPYIKREAVKVGIPPEDFIGIAIDGEHICFAQVRDDAIETQHLIPFSEYAVGLVMQAIRSETRRAVSIDNLLSDFGHGSRNAQSLMQAMANALADELAVVGNTKIKMLFEEWRTLYGQVADMSVLQADAISREMGFTWQGQPEQAMSGRLFIIHSYNSLLIKLLAAEIVSAHGLSSIQQPAQEMAALLDDAALLDSLAQNIERAGIFTQAGINGFVEEAIFSWYLDVARNKVHAPFIVPALRGILSALSLYRTDKLSHTRDVLRDLYQGLVPGKLRQSLGEFYTPDWLVDFAVENAQNGTWLNKRVLDPTCGSGAFLLAVIRRMRDEAIQEGWDSQRIVRHLCSSVWGFDLNPLAVQTARVNFLMEIADLLKAAPGQTLEVPVLLADAIYSPAPDPVKGQDVVKYQIGSQVAGLDIALPSALAFDRSRLDHIFIQMGEDVECDLEYPQSEAKLIASGLMTQKEATEWREPLQYTYDQILSLHRQQWNGIWFRVVRNFFWSATAGHFDCIVGNPPWVRWSKLPDAYRERVKPTCDHYGIFSKNKRHGGNELDISAMITYTTADKWLKADGRLVFVITGTVFKNPSSAGFRTFMLEPSNPKSAYLTPVCVDDMKGLKPFDDASNHTVVAVFNKTSQSGQYPVPYRLWSNKAGTTRNIPTQLSLDEVKQRIAIEVKEAIPVGETGSPWAVLTQGRHHVLKSISGQCSWTTGRKGITPDLNGIYYVPIVDANHSLVQIRSRPDAGRKDIGQARTAWVEPNLLYPLLKGAGDFEACYLKLADPARVEEKLYTFVPNRGIDKEEYSSSAMLMNSPELTKTKAWFSSYKGLLTERSTYRRQMKGAPFFGVYNVGEYTFMPWKVVWPEMSSRFYAAVVGDAEVPVAGMRPYVPDHKVYYSAFERKEEAFYLCGLLNTPMVAEWIESHTVNIQVGNIFKHTQLPEFDAGNADHIRLAALTETAHATHDAAERAEIINQIAALGEEILHHA
ncbi:MULTISPECIES: Eco57I restriction-modification methylase domain-containing protein [Aeromonas]|uniref:Eco57I restriction-modification methylase domain-containing protein n=1 Tax=Aeromonas TaxID=642 RepID=UPI001F1B899B|nr:MULTISPECIES: N-6 DNA methylase [Aeromonas]MCE9862392.1 N-6 DNA methylase [Aeromonas caviae]MCF3099616.1 SAM-dependent methyltransferase [Aeromonas australiensis]